MIEKFTKGEWCAKQDNGNWFSDDNYSLDTNYGSLSWVCVGCDGQAVAIVPDYDGDDSQLDGNAHLIASAPEMYETLSMILRDDIKGVEMCQVIESVLAKARGEL